MPASSDSVKRFSDRVVNYVKYRPSYPLEVATFLIKEFRLSENSVVVDIGSGTGKLSESLLQEGLKIIGVEPNKEMREAGEDLLSVWQNFKSVDGRAEATGLGDQSADLVVAGQAFHWFEEELSKLEMQRILKPGAGLALVWNERDETSSFLAAYEHLLHDHAQSYGEVNHRRIDDAVFERFFAPGKYKVFETTNCQYFDLEGLIGRYLSSSYSFNEDDARFPKARQALEDLFKHFSIDDRIRFDYNTRVYYGRFS